MSKTLTNLSSGEEMIMFKTLTNLNFGEEMIELKTCTGTMHILLTSLSKGNHHTAKDKMLSFSSSFFLPFNKGHVLS